MSSSLVNAQSTAQLSTLDLGKMVYLLIVYLFRIKSFGQMLTTICSTETT